MAKRKQFELGITDRPEESSREIERLFDAELSTTQRPVLRDLPVERIQPNPFQARQNFEHLEELVQSIRVQGFVSRLRVRPHPELADHFQLVFGERRLRAAAQAGMHTIPCEIAPHNDEQLIEIGLAENIQRQDLDPLEEAYAFRTFIEQRGYTQQRLADRIGKDVSYVTERLHILEDTPADVQEMVRQRTDTLRAAREIAKLPNAETRAPLIAQVLQRRLSTRDVRDAVRAQLERQAANRNVIRGSSTLTPAADRPLPAGRAAAVQAGNPHRSIDAEQLTRAEDPTRRVEEVGRESAVANGTTIDRDLRNVRAIFDRWQHQIETLNEPYLSRLIQFMVDEHLPQVDRIIQTMERKR